MSGLRIVSLLLKDVPVEDVFLYRTQLVCWTYESRLRVYEVSDIEDALRASGSDDGSITGYTLFHSKGLGATPEQRDAWARRETAPSAPIVIDGESIPFIEHAVPLQANTVLDMLLFYDRIYLSTDTGLMAIDEFHHPADGPLLAAKLLGQPCFGASGGLGAVAASCGDEGLRLLTGQSSQRRQPPNPRPIASRSVRAEIGYHTVVNHPSRARIEMFSGVTATSTSRNLIGVKAARVEAEADIGNVFSGTPMQGGLDFSLWNRSRLIAFTDGQIRSYSVRVSEDERIVGTASRLLGEYGGERGRVISADVVDRKMFFAEFEAGIGFLRDDDFVFVSVGPAASVRSYQRSHRYLRTVTSTTAEGVWFHGVVRPSRDD